MMAQETGSQGRLLLTGFEPFGGDTLNPSKELVQALDGQKIGRRRIQGLVLPVTYGLAAAMVLRELGCDPGDHVEGSEWQDADAWREWRASPMSRWTRPSYDVVLALGQAKGRDKICLERVAINLRDASLADHAGRVAQDEPIVPGGPAAYFSNLPLRAMLEAVQMTGVPVAISNTAGTYVCNDLLYLLLHVACGESAVHRYDAGGISSSLPDGGESGHPWLRVGFIHLPALPEQVRSSAEETGSAAQPPSLSFSRMKTAITAAIQAL